MITAVTIITIIISLSLYILLSTGMMFAFRKAGLRHAWFAYIPIAQYFHYLKVIRISQWNLLWLLAPIVAMSLESLSRAGSVAAVIVNLEVGILGLWWSIRYMKAFGMNPHRLWWILFPGVGIILILIFQLQLGFSKKYPYQFSEFY